MAVYVDNWRQPASVGSVTARWSHLLADTEDELHQFADRLGLRRAWFQEHPRHPARHHYDVTDALRREAIALGAVPVSWRQAGRMIRARRRGGPASPPGRGPLLELSGDPPGVQAEARAEASADQSAR